MPTTNLSKAKRPDVKVLLVEDNKGDARLISLLLEEIYGSGFELTLANTCSLALHLANNEKFDVALIDYNLPDGLGIELIRFFSKEDLAVPAILLTGHSERAIDLDAMNAGAADFLSKNNLQATQLERAIRYSVQRHSIEQELRRSKEELMRRNLQLDTAKAQLEAQTNNMMQLTEHLAQSELSEKTVYIIPQDTDQRLQELTEHCQICVWHVTNEGKTRYLNPAMIALLEIDLSASHSASDFLSFFTVDSRPEAECEFSKWQRGIGSTFESAIVSARSGKTKRLVLSGSPLAAEGGTSLDLLVTAVDITERRRIEASTREQARQDPLTGLLNRNALQEQLSQAQANANRAGHSVALLCLDLDHFKIVNDTQGHPFGDELLKLVAKRLKASVRETDCVARLGGDEFVVILNHLDSNDSAAIPAQVIIDKLSEPFCINGETVFTGTSIGIATFPDDSDTPEDLLKKADMALYRSKEVSRGGYEFFDHSILENLLRTRELEPALRQAITRNELHLMYQPQVCISGGEVVGVEALIRWESREKGALSPNEFIPLAESTGLIVPIGEWVLREACTQLREWHDEGWTELKMAVNVSVVQLKRESFIETVTTILNETGVSPRSLVLEVTESGIMDNVERATQILGALSSMGIGIALDDFGTGFASLTLLKEFPVEQIKIDRSFVSNMETDVESATIVSATIMLGHKLGLRVIGEGVETTRQLEFLRNEDCEEAQGYLFSKPMCSDDLVEWMQGCDTNKPAYFPEVVASQIS
ncbi:two-component system response regulator [Denitrobaculum tricleocarpae]|nr:EAL domain-containing protein [Denitrobaculum tricleocarpae]